MPASSARAFGDSVGVTVRFAWIDTAYGDFDKVEARLRELGVRYVTDGFCPTCDYQIDRMNRLASVGIKSNIGVSDLNAGIPAMEQSLQVIRDRLRLAVVSVTAPNEPDVSGDPLWVDHARAYQAALYARVKSDPALRHLAVLGPPLVNRESRPLLGDISANLDRGNIHPYPAGTMPMTHLDLERQLAAYVSKNKPLVATETGYHDDLSYQGVHRGAPESVVANYTPRSVLEAFRFGVERTYIYQLMDPWSAAGAQAKGVPTWQNSFGLLHSDFSRKPAFIALRNLLHTVKGDSAPVGSPGGLHLSLAGAGPEVRQLLLRAADGTYALVLWRQVSIWDRDAQQPLAPAPDAVDVVLGDRVALAQRFDPVASESETARWASPQRIPVQLGAAPVVLRLTTPAAQDQSLGRTKAKRKRAHRRHRQQLARRLSVRASCARPCASVAARGRLVVGRGHHQKTFKLRSARRAGHGVVVLRLRVPAHARRVAAKTLKRGGPVRARVRIVRHAKSGAKLSARSRTIRLRR